MSTYISRAFSVIFSVVLLLAVATVSTNAQELNLSNIGPKTFNNLHPNDNVFGKYFTYLFHQGVYIGDENIDIQVDEAITRGDFARMVKLGFGIPTNTSAEQFVDLDSSDPNYKYIMSLRAAGVISGTSQNEFLPNNTLTRAEAAKIIVNAGNFSVENISSTSMFPDLSSDNVFYEFIQTIAQISDTLESEKKMISGYSDGTFKPDELLTQGQISKIVANGMFYKDIDNVDCVDYYCTNLDLETKLEYFMFHLVNRSRGRNNVVDATEDKQAALIAKEWSTDMANTDNLEHNKNLLEDFLDDNIPARYVSENVSFQTLINPSQEVEYYNAVKKLHDIMMAEVPPEDGHLRNILNTDYNFDHLGVGVVVGMYNAQFNQQIIWVTENYYENGDANFMELIQ